MRGEHASLWAAPGKRLIVLEQGRRRRPSRSQVRRRRAAALLAILGVGGIVTVAAVQAGDSTPSPNGRSGEGSAAAARRPPPPPPPELPGGGRSIFPERRVVAFYGAPGSEELGALGIGTPDQAGRRLLAQARPYRRPRRPVLPAMELIATVVTQSPASQYRFRQSDAVIRRYLKAARKRKALLILDIQPGRAKFMDEVRHFRKWLREPDVSLALDPEWSMAPGQVPGQQIGATDAATVNRVSRYLSEVIRRDRLPEKLLVIHQFTDDMIRDRASLTSPPGVELTLNVDGFGGRGIKVEKYRGFTSRRDPWHHGFKLFYREDTGLMTPPDVLRLRPVPELVIYE